MEPGADTVLPLHGAQLLALPAATAVEKVLAGHCVHVATDVALVAELYVPAAHETQLDMPATDHVPALHVAHTPPCAKEPAAQTRHTASALAVHWLA